MGFAVELPTAAPVPTVGIIGLGAQAPAAGDLFAALIGALAPMPETQAESSHEAPPLAPPGDRLDDTQSTPPLALALAVLPVPILPSQPAAEASAANSEAEGPIPPATGDPQPAAAHHQPNVSQPEVVAQSGTLPESLSNAAAADPAAWSAGPAVEPPRSDHLEASHSPRPTAGPPTDPTDVARPDTAATHRDPAPTTLAAAPPDGEAEHLPGVVRTVGNAETTSRAEVKAEPVPAEHRPLPRPSQAALAHAAPNSAVGQLREAAPPSEAAPPPAPDPTGGHQAGTIQNLDAVATAVIERVEAGGGEARIHLEPAGLGEITIRLQARHEAVHLDIHAETPEAVQLLRDAAADLSSLLGQRGMNLAGLDIGLGARQGGNGGWANLAPARATAEPGTFAAILGLEDQASTARHHRLRAAYNPDGSHLYRV